MVAALRVVGSVERRGVREGELLLSVTCRIDDLGSMQFRKPLQCIRD